jgi:diguanylate cyclase (GGDEF)-like protein
MVASRGDSQAICDLAASELRALAGVERAVLYLGEENAETLEPAADVGLSAEERQRVRGTPLKLSLPALAPVLERRVPIILDQRPPREISHFDDVRAVLLLPLTSRDEIIGAVVLLSSRDDHPFDAGRVDFLQDVAQQIAFGLENARLFTALSRLASTDELTGLANRRRFLEVAESELARCLEADQPFALVLADLDHLKRINDSHGHAAGDQAVAHAAHALEAERGEGELAARVGGEEFAILMPGSDLEAALERAGAACGALANGFVSGVGRVTASFGVAAAPADGRTTSELLKAADGRLYRAKALGRNRVCGPEVD